METTYTIGLALTAERIKDACDGNCSNQRLYWEEAARRGFTEEAIVNYLNNKYTPGREQL